MRAKGLDIPFNGVNIYNLRKNLGIEYANTVAEWYAGKIAAGYAGDLIDISGRDRHLADTGSPVKVPVSTLDHRRNPLQAFDLTGTQYFSASHASWMNIYTGDFTISCILRSPTSNPAGTIYFFSHGINASGGASVYMDSSGRFGMILGDSLGTPLNVKSLNGHADGKMHLVLFIRRSNYGYVLVDGVASEVASAPVSVATYGDDVSCNLYVGCYGGADGLTPGNHYTAPLVYLRLQNNALSFARARRELMLLQGVVGGKAAGRYVRPTFIRNAGTNILGTSYVPRVAGDKSLVQVPADWPVKSEDGAITVHASLKNYLLQTQTFSTTWAKLNLGGGTDVINANVASPLAPDGTQTVDGIAGSTADVVHGITQAATITATGFGFMAYAYKGDKDWLYLSNNTLSCSAFFNINTGYVGTVTGTGCTAEIQKDPTIGCWRAAIYFTGTAAAHTVQISPANADGDADFAGDGTTNNIYIWQADLIPEKHMCLPVPATTVAQTRAGDYCTYLPWQITKNSHKFINPIHPTRSAKTWASEITGGSPILSFRCDESLSGGIVTPTTGAYPFIKDGAPTNGESTAEGKYFYFDGVDDGLYRAGSAAFNPTGNFSIIAAWTPGSVAAGSVMIISKQGSSGDRGWYLTQSGTGVVFGRSADGTNTVTATVSTCLEVGKPALIRATFSTTRGMILRVSDFAAATEATLTATYACTARVAIGHNSSVAPSTGNYAIGKLSELHFFNNYEVSDAECMGALRAWEVADVNPLNTVAPMLLFDGTETFGGTSITPTTGSYTFTTSGLPKNDWNEEEGDHFRFASPDYFYVDSADFNPAADFSMIASYTPLQTSGTFVIAGKWNATGNQRGWQLYQSNATMNLSITTDGTTTVTAQIAACIEIGKPMLISASYGATGGPQLRVDAYHWTYAAASGRVLQSTANLIFGALSGPANYLVGKLHGYAFINGYVITAVDHAAMYANFKRPGLLPLYISPLTEKTKIMIELEMKAHWKAGPEIVATRYPVFIGGATGVSSSTRNGVTLLVADSGTPILRGFDNNAASKSTNGDLYSDYDRWHRFECVIDCANMAGCLLYKDGVSVGTAAGSGASTFDLKDSLVRIGQSQNSIPNVNADIRNVKVWTE